MVKLKQHNEFVHLLRQIIQGEKNYYTGAFFRLIRVKYLAQCSWETEKFN